MAGGALVDDVATNVLDETLLLFGVGFLAFKEGLGSSNGSSSC